MFLSLQTAERAVHEMYAVVDTAREDNDQEDFIIKQA